MKILPKKKLLEKLLSYTRRVNKKAVYPFIAIIYIFNEGVINICIGITLGMFINNIESDAPLWRALLVINSYTFNLTLLAFMISIRIYIENIIQFYYASTKKSLADSVLKTMNKNVFYTYFFIILVFAFLCFNIFSLAYILQNMVSVIILNSFILLRYILENVL